MESEKTKSVSRWKLFKQLINPLKWFDIIWGIVWVFFLVVLGAFASGLYSESFTNAGNLFIGIFAAVLVIPPILRAMPSIVRHAKHATPANLKTTKEVIAGGKN